MQVLAAEPYPNAHQKLISKFWILAHKEKEGTPNFNFLLQVLCSALAKMQQVPAMNLLREPKTLRFIFLLNLKFRKKSGDKKLFRALKKRKNLRKRKRKKKKI